jgi:hypothetical protein
MHIRNLTMKIEISSRPIAHAGCIVHKEVSIHSSNVLPSLERLLESPSRQVVLPGSDKWTTDYGASERSPQGYMNTNEEV